MAKKEIKTDLWVYKLLEDAHINLDAQGSNIKEINDALKTGTKKGTGKNPGYPDSNYTPFLVLSDATFSLMLCTVAEGVYSESP